jgi:hypothetical protein
MRLTIGLTVTAALAASLVAPPGSMAATEFGDSCVATKVAPVNDTLTTLQGAAGQTITAPSAGVITKVRVSAFDTPLPFSTVPTAVKVLRPAGGNRFTTVDQTTVNASTIGLTVANVRMPVQAGDRLGLHGEPFTYEGSTIESLNLYCPELTEGTLGAVMGDVPKGATAEYVPVAPARVPLSAVLEPDADNDGFGDETQDKCPRSAATQAECPVIVLDSYVLPSKSKAVVLVSASSAAPVTVSGTAKLPKAPKKAGASAQAKLKSVTKGVTAGKLNRFTLKFPATLKSAIAALTPGKSITVKLQASATDIAGQKVIDKAQLKIKG